MELPSQKPSFAESWQYSELLEISKSHLDQLDRSRDVDGRIVGMDNFAKLKVSTVFAAIAVEAALNDYLLCHCLLARPQYLQKFFGAVTKRFLWARPEEKIDLLKKSWNEEFPSGLLRDVRRLFEIRNRIIHQTSEFRVSEEPGRDTATMTSRYPISQDDIQEMLRHYDVARDFLSRFWLPGNSQLSQGQRLNNDTGSESAQ